MALWDVLKGSPVKQFGKVCVRMPARALLALHTELLHSPHHPFSTHTPTQTCSPLAHRTTPRHTTPHLLGACSTASSMQNDTFGVCCVLGEITPVGRVQHRVQHAEVAVRARRAGGALRPFKLITPHHTTPHHTTPHHTTLHLLGACSTASSTQKSLCVPAVRGEPSGLFNTSLHHTAPHHAAPVGRMQHCVQHAE